jgi:hypothetical protein
MIGMIYYEAQNCFDYAFLCKSTHSHTADCEADDITLSSLQRAAAIVGRRVFIDLV